MRSGASVSTSSPRRPGRGLGVALLAAGFAAALWLGYLGYTINARSNAMRALDRFAAFDIAPTAPDWVYRMGGDWAYYGFGRVEWVVIDTTQGLQGDASLLKYCDGLTMLELHGEAIDAAWISAVGTLDRLDTLLIWGADRLRDADLEPLARMSRLESIELMDVPVTDAVLAHLSGLSKLWSIDIVGGDIRGDGMAHLSGLTELRHLRIRYEPLSDEAIDRIGSMTRLESLSVGMGNPRAIEKLAGLVELRELELSGRIDDESLAHLRGMTKLASLWIGHSREVTDVGMEHLAGFEQLRSLDLDGTGVTAAGLARLPEGIEELGLAETRIGDDVAYAAERFPRLRRLDLRGTQVTDRGVAGLARIRTLESIDLQGTNVTDASVDALIAIPALRSVEVFRTGLTEAGKRRLEAALQSP